jgi:L-alanine-DL-glutamate epimerase-like enolase superfamily enzyme
MIVMMLEPNYSDQHAWPPILDLKSAYSTPLPIQSVELLRYRGVYFVRTISEDGAEGIATINDRIRFFWPMFKDLVVPAFIGQDARELEKLVNEVYIFNANYKYQGTPFWNCVSYIEASLFDMLGKVSSKSVGELIGGAWRREVPIYLSSLRRDTMPEEEIQWLSERLADTNAVAVKMKIGGRMLNNADSSPGRTEKLIRLARETWGDDVTLYMDANGSYDCSKAIQVGKLLEEYNYGWFEEPCPFEQYEETKAVADALDIDIAGGEQDCNLGQFRTMIRTRTVDIVQPDMMYNGGIVRALRVAQMAREAGIKITPHSPRNNPELATLIHFASVVQNTGPFMEFSAVKVDHEDWYDPKFTVEKGGFIKVPTGPGLGISYDDSVWKDAEII